MRRWVTGKNTLDLVSGSTSHIALLAIPAATVSSSVALEEGNEGGGDSSGKTDVEPLETG